MSKTNKLDRQISAELATLSEEKDRVMGQLGEYQTAALWDLAAEENDEDERVQLARRWARLNSRSSHLFSCLCHAIIPSPLPGQWA